MDVYSKISPGILPHTPKFTRRTSELLFRSYSRAQMDRKRFSGTLWKCCDHNKYKYHDRTNPYMSTKFVQDIVRLPLRISNHDQRMSIVYGSNYVEIGWLTLLNIVINHPNNHLIFIRFILLLQYFVFNMTLLCTESHHICVHHIYWTATVNSSHSTRINTRTRISGPQMQMTHSTIRKIFSLPPCSNGNFDECHAPGKRNLL